MIRFDSNLRLLQSFHQLTNGVLVEARASIKAWPLPTADHFRRTGGPKLDPFALAFELFWSERGIPLETFGVWCFSMLRCNVSSPVV